MTYDEFYQLATQPERPEGVDSVFMLTAYASMNLPERKRQHYPQYSLYGLKAGIYHTLAQAEQAINTLVGRFKRDGDDDEPYYSFIVEEMQISSPQNPGSERLSWYLYDPDGNLVLHSLATGYDCDVPERFMKFRGRTGDTIHFKEGDIVEVADYYRHEVRLAVVTSTPVDVQWCWDYRQRLIGSVGTLLGPVSTADSDVEAAYRVDTGDDCYIVIDGPGPEWHSHIPSYCISAPRYPIPPYMVKRLKHNYQRYLTKCEALARQRMKEEK